MQAAKKIWDDWSGASKKRVEQTKDQLPETSPIKVFFVRKSQGEFSKENQNLPNNTQFITEMKSEGVKRPQSAFQTIKRTSIISNVVNYPVQNRVIHSSYLTSRKKENDRSNYSLSKDFALNVDCNNNNFASSNINHNEARLLKKNFVKKSLSLKNIIMKNKNDFTQNRAEKIEELENENDLKKIQMFLKPQSICLFSKNPEESKITPKKNKTFNFTQVEKKEYFPNLADINIERNINLIKEFIERKKVFLYDEICPQKLDHKLLLEKSKGSNELENVNINNNHQNKLRVESPFINRFLLKNMYLKPNVYKSESKLKQTKNSFNERQLTQTDGE